MEIHKKRDNKNKSKHELKQKRENIEKITEVIENKKKIPKEELGKINNKVFENIAFAIGIMLYMYFIILGSININTASFITDLKVFSFLTLFLSIILFEKSFKRTDKKLCIHGIEILVLAFETLIAIYNYSLFVHKFKLIIALESFTFGIYYIIKSIYIYIKLIKDYHKKTNDIKDIIKEK